MRPLQVTILYQGVSFLFVFFERIACMKRLLSLLAPANCYICQRIGSWLCSGCLENLTWYQGAALSQLVVHPGIERILSVVEYRDSVETLMTLVKKGNYFSLVELWSQLTYIAYPRLLSKNDVLLPVPTTWQREWERGFSPTLVYAKHLAKHFGAKIHTTTLIRTKDDGHQAQKSRSQRQETENMYAVYNSPPEGRLWIIDDVITTGATVSACARALSGLGRTARVLTFAATV